MKKLTILLTIICASFCAHSQNVKQDSQGNYIAVKTSKTDSVKVTLTGKTFTTLNGEVYKVYLSARGKEFIYRIAKSGTIYKYYIKP